MPTPLWLHLHKWRAVPLGLVCLGIVTVVWQMVPGGPSGPLQVSILGEKTVVALAGSGNSGCGQGNGGPSGSKDCSNPGHPISVSERHLGALSPGESITLDVTVVNPNNQDVQLTQVHVDRGAPSNPRCDGTWFPVTDFNGSLTIKKRSQIVVPIPMSMADTATDQDACKGVTIPLTFKATVTGA